MRQIKVDQVMPEKKRGPFGEIIQLPQCIAERHRALNKSIASVAAHRGKPHDATIVDTHFQVERQASGAESFIRPAKVGVIKKP